MKEKVNINGIGNIQNSGTYFEKMKVDKVNKVEMHSDTGKDKVLEVREQQMEKMFHVLTEELHNFYKILEKKEEYIVRKDDYIKNQDRYIAEIVKNSYLRNKENMERLDEMFREIAVVIDQQNKVINFVNESFYQQIKLIEADKADMRKQMDRILTMLESTILK